MTTLARRRPFTLNGWHVLAAFVLFFAADIAVNTWFIVTAYRTYPGETSATPYQDGIVYNRALAQKRAQAALGWRLSAGADTGGRIRVDVADRTGAPLHGLSVEARLTRPATEAGERTLRLAEATPGVYLAPAGSLNGAWDLEVSARDGAGRLALAERRLILP